MLPEEVKDNNNISKISEKLFKVSKKSLISPLDKEGRQYQDTDTYGIFREDTREAIGTSKGVFTPAQPRVLFDTFLSAILEMNLSPDNLSYTELKGGSKILFNLEIDRTTQINKAGKTDDMVYNLGFMTGFDGSTKSQVFVNSKRLICLNGMRVTNSEYNFSRKNTKYNMISISDFLKNMTKVLKDVKNYTRFINKLNSVSVGKSTVEDFIIECLSIQDPSNVSSQMKNKARDLNKAIEIEIDRTGYNAFALLNGATYYTNHMCNTKSKNDFLLLGSGKKINDKAQKFVAELA